MKKYMLPLLGVAFLTAACENEVDFKGGERSPKMILKTLLGPETEDREIQVSESVFLFGDRKPQPVNDAVFRIWKNGAEVPVTHNNQYAVWDNESQSYVYETINTTYTFTAPLSPGDKLEIAGESPLHGNISGADVMPDTAMIRGIQTEWFTGGAKSGMSEEVSYLRTLVTLADRPGEKNYYRILIRSETDYTHTWVDKYHWDDELMTHVTDTLSDKDTWTNSHTVYVDQEVLFNNIGSVLAGDEDSAQQYRIFSDELFAGREYTLNVYIQLDRPLDHWGGGNFGGGVGGLGYTVDAQRVTVEIQTLSESLFLYLRSIELAMTENNFSEPVKIHTNIAGGYGIFGLYNVATQTVEIPLSE